MAFAHHKKREKEKKMKKKKPDQFLEMLIKNRYAFAIYGAEQMIRIRKMKMFKGRDFHIKEQTNSIPLLAWENGNSSSEFCNISQNQYKIQNSIAANTVYQTYRAPDWKWIISVNLSAAVALRNAPLYMNIRLQYKYQNESISLTSFSFTNSTCDFHRSFRTRSFSPTESFNNQKATYIEFRHIACGLLWKCIQTAAKQSARQSVIIRVKPLYIYRCFQ